MPFLVHKTCLAWGLRSLPITYMTNNGWIKLHRQFRESPYYKIAAAMQTWVECLLRASHDDRLVFLKRERLELKQGQFVMGRDEFGHSIGISGSTAWYWLLQFEADSMVDIKKTAKGSIVSVKNWSEYQKVDSEVDNRKTADEQQMNTNKKEKNVKNDKNVPSEHGNSDVNKIIQCMEECFGTLDSTKGKNRQYAWLLLKKAGMNVEACMALARGASQHDWWKSRITKVESLYKNAHLITNALREKTVSRHVVIS